MAPIPIPKPIPNKNIYDQSFEELWSSLNIKRGSKFSANKIFQKISEETQDIDIAEIYNKQQSGVEAKFVPHFSTWLSQRRWEIDEKDQKHQINPADLRTKMENLGYNFRHSEDNFDYFKKDGKEYKIFGEGGVEKTAKEFNKEFLGHIPLNQDLRNSADIGDPLTHSQPDHEVSKIFKSVAEKIKLSFL